jgi:hypothetical protein
MVELLQLRVRGGEDLPWPIRNRSKCSATSQHAGGPPKPVAKPFVPSEASISTQNEPKTLMPQLVLDFRYSSYWDMGVAILLSTNQWPPCTLW